MRPHNKIVKPLVLAVLMFIYVGAAAQSDAPPNAGDLYSINADDVVVDNDNGVKTYSGKATVVVANLIIEADSISIFGLDGIPSKIEAKGNPISFREQVAKQNFNGTAREVTFVVSELKLTLSDYSITDPSGNNMKGKKASFVLSP